MVKNTFGGNKHKCQARKFTNTKSSNKLRIAEEIGEIYCIVTHMLGNSMFYAHGIDNCKKLGFIRGKFSGRGKRDNIVEIGKWVLLGEREWDNKKEKSNEIMKCDLLEVYNDLDKERLKDTVPEKWEILMLQDDGKSAKDFNKNEELFEFSTQKEEECQKILDELADNKSKVIELKTNNENANDWINIDDI